MCQLHKVKYLICGNSQYEPATTCSWYDDPANAEKRFSRAVADRCPSLTRPAPGTAVVKRHAKCFWCEICGFVRRGELPPLTEEERRRKEVWAMRIKCWNDFVDAQVAYTRKRLERAERRHIRRVYDAEDPEPVYGRAAMCQHHHHHHHHHTHTHTHTHTHNYSPHPQDTHGVPVAPGSDTDSHSAHDADQRSRGQIIAEFLSDDPIPSIREYQSWHGLPQA
ncbi:unnamed protein product [Diplocarpon coronariae]